jgi:hypothetical protein
VHVPGLEKATLSFLTFGGHIYVVSVF